MQTTMSNKQTTTPSMYSDNKQIIISLMYSDREMTNIVVVSPTIIADFRDLADLRDFLRDLTDLRDLKCIPGPVRSLKSFNGWMDAIQIGGTVAEKKTRTIIADTQAGLLRQVDEKKIPTTVEKFTPKTGSRSWQLIRTNCVRLPWDKNDWKQKSVRKWPSNHVIDEIPEYCDVLCDGKSPYIILSFVTVVDHILGQLPYPCWRSLQKFIEELVKLEAMNDLRKTDAEQVGIHVFLEYLEEHGIEPWDGRRVAFDLIDRLLSRLRRQQNLYHRFMLDYDLLGLENEQTLLAISQELSPISPNMYIIDLQSYYDQITDGDFSVWLYDSSCVPFKNYREFCRGDIRPHHRFLAELSSVIRKDPAFEAVRVKDENYEKLLEAEARFDSVIEIGERRRETTRGPQRLSQMCLVMYTTYGSRISDCSDALDLSRLSSIQRENGRKLNSRSTVISTTNGAKKAQTSSIEQILLECYLASVEIARINGNLAKARLHIDKIMTILPELDVAGRTATVILLEEAKYHFSVGKPFGGRAILEEALEIDDRNLDCCFYYALTDSVGAKELLVKWLREEPVQCPSRFYLIFLTESDLPLLEDHSDVYVELRYVMGLEDANVKFLKEKPDRGHDMIRRIPFPARTLLAYLAFQVLASEKVINRQNEDLKSKCQKVMRSTAQRCSGNTVYQAYTLLGHLQGPEQAAETYTTAIKKFDGPGSYLVKQRLWELSRAEKKRRKQIGHKK